MRPALFAPGQIIIPVTSPVWENMIAIWLAGPEVGIDLSSDMLRLVQAIYRIAAGGDGQASLQGVALWIRKIKVSDKSLIGQAVQHS